MFGKHCNVVLQVLVSIYFFIIPFFIIVHDLRDPAFHTNGVTRWAVRLHKRLTPRLHRWARDRLRTKAGKKLGVDNISGTEWPLFGCMFYLLGTEALQVEWEKDRSISDVAPRDYAAEAITSAVDLVTDPGHASWVKEHWGDDYLHIENVFYRMLLISSITSHYNLLGEKHHLPLLKDQVESMSRELAESPHGVLDDYPGECYPTDVLSAIAAIGRADKVLGTDHSEFIMRSRRGFSGECLDERGLPPYGAVAVTGEPLGTSRGCGVAYGLIFSPEIWPETARQWYPQFEKYFWQKRYGAAGFREYPVDRTGYDWYFDVDAGPVTFGYGFAACAFGLAAARTNGRFDQAFPLLAVNLVACWPLLDGTLLFPRILSNAADAPYLGESCMVFIISRQPAHGFTVKEGGAVPVFVHVMLALYLLAGLTLAAGGWWRLRRLKKRAEEFKPGFVKLQYSLWGGFTLAGLACLFTGSYLPALFFLLCAQLLPR